MRFRKTGNGFSIVELLVVISIFGLLLSASGPVYRRVQDKQQSEADMASIAQTIRRAQQLATTASQDSGWGVKITANQATIFMGVSYASRNMAHDQSITYYSVANVTGTNEYSFNKLTGNPIVTGTTTLVTRWGTKNITLNAKGMVDY